MKKIVSIFHFFLLSIVAYSQTSKSELNSVETTVDSKGITFLDEKGNQIGFVEIKVKNRRISPVKNGLVAVYPYRSGGMVDILDSKAILNSFKLKYIYDLYILSNSHLAVRGDDTSLKYALYDIKGNKKSQTLYAAIGAPDENNYFFVDKGFNAAVTFGYLDADGKEIIPANYKSLGFFNKNGITHANGNLINRNNEIVKKAEKDTTYFNRKNSTQYLYSTYAALFGILDHNFKALTPPIFSTSLLKVLDSKQFSYTINNKAYVIDENGKINPGNGSLEYETALAFMPKQDKIQNTYEWNIPNYLLKISTEKKYAPAQKTLDSLYSNANYVKLNPKAKEIFFDANLEKNALAGNTNSMYELGKAHLYGINPFPVNIEKGLKWMHTAADKNYQKAAYELVFYYIRAFDEENAKKLLNNYKGEKDWSFKELYLPGELDKILAIQHYNSKNSSKEKADGYFKKAINAGNLSAGYEYGYRLLSSKNPEYEAQGLKLLNANVAKGDVKSMLHLANYYSIYTNEPSKVNRTSSNTYYNMVLNSSIASIYEKNDAKLGISENTKKEPLDVGTVLNIDNQKKAIVFRDAYGFRTNDNKYYTSAQSNYTDYKKYNIVKGAIGTKKCTSCNGTGKQQKQVVSGSYTTKDVTYKTGSTISGDKKITTTTTHNTYKSVDEKCLVCNGNGLLFSK